MFKIDGLLVRKKGLEPLRLAVLAPEASASTNSATFAFLVGDPDEIRTHDHRFRRPILYPSELRDQLESHSLWAHIISIFFQLAI